jgi:hypothetical protein
MSKKELKLKTTSNPSHQEQLASTGSTNNSSVKVMKKYDKVEGFGSFNLKKKYWLV